jgi:hypothetical protein
MPTLLPAVLQCTAFLHHQEDNLSPTRVVVMLFSEILSDSGANAPYTIKLMAAYNLRVSAGYPAFIRKPDVALANRAS